MAKVLGINHVGLAPKDPAKARWFFETALGLGILGEELVREQETHTLMLRTASDDAGAPEARLEILVPAPAGAIATFLEKKGSGIHHVALNVVGIEALIARLVALGVRMIDAAPRTGAHKTRIAFVHPVSTGGLLVELVEEARSE